VSGRAKKLAGAGEELGAAAIGLQAVVSNANEAPGQHVKEKTANKFGGREGEDSSLVSATAVAIAEAHAAILKSEQPLVAEGDAMSVATEVAQYLIGAGHGRLAVDDPGLGRGLLKQMTAKGVGDTGTARSEGVLEEFEQLASKDRGEHTHGHEKTGTGCDPALTSGVEPTPGHDAVEVWMKA
jgi:hypothetical protein